MTDVQTSQCQEGLVRWLVSNFHFFVRRGSSLSPIRTSTPLLGTKATTAATRVAMPEVPGGELRNA